MCSVCWFKTALLILRMSTKENLIPLKISEGLKLHACRCGGALQGYKEVGDGFSQNLGSQVLQFLRTETNSNDLQTY